MTTYFGFGMADGMFPSECVATRTSMTTGQAAAAIEAGVVSVCNPSHAATISALQERHGIKVEIPAKAPVVSLKPGDSLIVFSPRGLPRLENRHEYTTAEIEAAVFVFGLWRVE